MTGIGHEGVILGQPFRHRFEDLGSQLDDLPAAAAHGVVVRVASEMISGRSGTEPHVDQNSGVGQKIECPVDRGKMDVGMASLYERSQRLDGKVLTFSGRKLFEHGPTGRGDPLAPGP